MTPMLVLLFGIRMAVGETFFMRRRRNRSGR
jgi:hypothetical protein